MISALDDDSSYHTNLQLLQFKDVQEGQKERYAVIHGSKRGLSVLELVQEDTQSTDSRIGQQWNMKYHTKLESNGFGSSATIIRSSKSKKEKIIFFGGYFHENQHGESSDKSSLFQQQQRYSLEGIQHHKSLTSRVKKFFKSNKSDLAACPHPSNMFFQYKFKNYEFRSYAATDDALGEKSSNLNGSNSNLTKKTSFLGSSIAFWPCPHANHSILLFAKQIYIFGGNYLNWSDLNREDPVSDEAIQALEAKKSNFVFAFDLKKKKFETPKMASFRLPRQSNAIGSDNLSDLPATTVATPRGNNDHQDNVQIQLPIEDVDSKQKERRVNLLDSIKLFNKSRDRGNSEKRNSTELRDATPLNRFGHSIVNVNGVAYIYGGKNRNPDLQSSQTFFDDHVYSYNFRTGQFSRQKVKSSEKPQPRMFHSMVDIPENNCFLMMGGHSVNDHILDDERLSMMMDETSNQTQRKPVKYFDDCFLFDILRSEWTNIKCTGHLPIPAQSDHRTALALSRTSEGKFLCIVKNGQEGSLEVYEGKANF